MSEQDDSPKKAMSFKDRIAMFNQPKAAASAPGPPPRATKPRAFKWKTSGEAEEGGSKTLSVADVPPQPPTPTPGASAPSTEGASSEQPAVLTDKPGAGLQASGAPLEPVSSTASGASVVSAEDSVKHKGFSAEDARQSAGSLKERIALLSGLKVDKPDAPGRAPKPWRKKTEEPVEGADKRSSATEVTSPSSEQPEGAIPSAEYHEEGNQESAKDSTVPTIAIDTEEKPVMTSSEKPATEAAVSPSSEDKHNIALPAMPTRARGPRSKARAGTASPAVASPSLETAPISEPASKTAPVKSESIPSIADIGSPSAGPEELGNPIPAASMPSDKAATETSIASKNKETTSGTNDDQTAGSAPKRTSTNLLARSVPLPPPTASTTAEEQEDEVRKGHAAKEDDENEEVQSLQASLAKQSLDDRSPVTDDMPPAVPSPVSRPPAPPALDTAMSPRPEKVTTPTEVTSPTSANTNRRSMTRPPVPSAYSQESAPAPASPRSSFDNRSQRSSIAESHRGSLVMSPTQPGILTAEPDDLAGDGEFANPAIDSKDKIVVPPPVSKPFETDSSAPAESPRSPQRQGSIPMPQQRRASEILAGGSTGSGMPPVRMASSASQKSSTDVRDDKDEPETNISAMKAYRAPTQEETPRDNAEDREDEEEEYEDPEVARRQALAKRMAAMGGMKIGMLPQMPSMLKRKKTLPKEPETMDQSEGIASTQSAPVAPETPPTASREVENESVERPPARTAPSFKPPTGAFVLPMPGKPAASPPAIPPPAVPPPPAPEEDEEQTISDDEDRQDAALDANEGDDEEDSEQVGAADDTVTQPLEDDDTEELETPPPPPPPPIPAARPPPPPPVGQSFIETDTDTDGGASEKRNSMASSTGMGSLSDFPAPPAGAPPAAHVRTQSSASRYSSQDHPDTLYEESESTESHGAPSEQAETVLPPRPARAPPQLDTSAGGSGGRAPSRRESMAEPASPAQSVHSYSQRSLPETPVSPSGRNASQERFGALSPTTSHSSKRSSAVMVGQQGHSGGLGNIQPGLNNDYLAYIAMNSSKTKSRDVDGPLAHTLNDIAYTYRNDPGNFGSIVYRMLNTGVKGQVPELDIHGRIEPGCVFFAWDAKFDRGLGRSSLKVGSAEVPHVGIVAEGVKDIKKAKVKVVELVQGRHNVETYKLDDLKSGLVEVRRLA